MSHVVRERKQRRIFTSSDGRILGVVESVKEWYEPFSGNPETKETVQTVETREFLTAEEARDWERGA